MSGIESDARLTHGAGSLHAARGPCHALDDGVAETVGRVMADHIKGMK